MSAGMFTDYGAAICAPFAIMGEKNIPCACEADVYGSLTQLILQEISKSSVFLTDIVDVDVHDNTAVVWHCGQAQFLWQKNLNQSLQFIQIEKNHFFLNFLLNLEK